MRANVSVLTATAQSDVSQSVVAYQNAVANHVGGDWGVHTQLQFYATVYTEPSTGATLPNGYLLRAQLSGTNTDGTGDGVFTLPVLFSGSLVPNGSAPIILQQPVSTTVAPGATATFSVVAASADPMSYQWFKNNVAIGGATAASLVIASAASTDQTVYYVTVSNTYGSVISTIVALTLS